MFRKVLLIVCVLVLAFAVKAFADGRFDFAVIQPGQPGSTADAQPVMDELASYLSNKTGVPVKGVYFNDLSEATAYLGSHTPAWGITGLTFFRSFKDKFKMVPVAATLPQGLEKDVWRLIVPADGPDSVAEIKGKVYGSMLYTPEARDILLGNENSSFFEMEGTHRALRMLRKVNKGRAAGVCLDAVQYSVIEGSGRYDNIKVVFTSQKLPTSPVVWFGKTTDDSIRLQSILLDMSSDPAAQDLLKLLQTEGFNPADGGLE